MKFNYNEEFDLLEIYRKLTAPSAPMTVSASEFFDDKEAQSLRVLQAIAARIVAQTTCNE